MLLQATRITHSLGYTHTQRQESRREAFGKKKDVSGREKEEGTRGEDMGGENTVVGT